MSETFPDYWPQVNCKGLESLKRTFWLFVPHFLFSFNSKKPLSLGELNKQTDKCRQKQNLPSKMFNEQEWGSLVWQPSIKQTKIPTKQKKRGQIGKHNPQLSRWGHVQDQRFIPVVVENRPSTPAMATLLWKTTSLPISYPRWLIKGIWKTLFLVNEEWIPQV